MDARQRQSDICQDDENQAPSLYSTILVFLSQQNKKRIGKLAIRVKHLQLLYNYCFFPTAMVPSCSTSWLFLMMILSRRQLRQQHTAGDLEMESMSSSRLYNTQYVYIPTPIVLLTNPNRAKGKRLRSLKLYYNRSLFLSMRAGRPSLPTQLPG